MLMSLFESIQNSALAIFVAESSWAFPTIESIHVLFLVLVVGTISIVDLRLLGWNSTGRPVMDVVRDVLPMTWASFAIALVSGLLLFISNATQYAANWPFRIKLGLLALAGINMLAFHFLSLRNVSVWGTDRTPPKVARLAGGLSLSFWIGVVVCGRWIGFTI